jgi:hypothetical protein
MQTEMILYRPILGGEVRQKHKTQALSATDLVKIGNKIRISRGEEPFDLSYYLSLKGTKEFMGEIESKYGWAKYASRGKNATTWVHPILFIDVALAISPALKLELYEWIMDTLCEFRDESGDSYKLMCGVLWVRSSNKKTFSEYVRDVAVQIKKVCHVEEWNKADSRQLEMRDAIHKDIAWLAEDLNNNQIAVEMVIRKYSKGHNN